MSDKIKKDHSPTIIELDETTTDEITVDKINLAACSPYYYQALKRKNPDSLHSQFLLNLTHERLCEEEAELLWRSIISHMRELNVKLQRSVGIAVAAMDYLTNINTTISNPVLIDEEFSSEIVKNSTKDDLTKLYTREFFDCALNHEISVWRREKSPLCLMMIDLDDFKKINDDYGHQIGDAVLKAFSEVILTHIRDTDIAVRYGGEEFAIIMPNCEIEPAEQVAERVRGFIEKTNVLEDKTITASIGLSQMSTAIRTAEQLIHEADVSLYKAKANGKNQIEVSISNYFDSD